MFQNLSPLKRVYWLRLLGRCMIFIACDILWVAHPELFDILYGWNFFKKFSVLHILWGIWMIDMLVQLLPIPAHVALGSQKLFAKKFRADEHCIDRAAARAYIRKSNPRALLILVIWFAAIGGIGLLHHVGFFTDIALFMITAAFFVFDLVCVLMWCPFRDILKTRCCTTCRIFNWDHMMMFTPMMFIPGFYGLSLLFVSLLVWGLWELEILLHPERFWERTNQRLRCSNCTDHLCSKKYIPPHS